MTWKVHSLLQREAAKQCYVGVYHADLTPHTKSAVYSQFKSAGSSLRCLIATVAFGMVCEISSHNYVLLVQYDILIRAWIFLTWRLLLYMEVQQQPVNCTRCVYRSPSLRENFFKYFFRENSC